MGDGQGARLFAYRNNERSDPDSIRRQARANVLGCSRRPSLLHLSLCSFSVTYFLYTVLFAL